MLYQGLRMTLIVMALAFVTLGWGQAFADDTVPAPSEKAFPAAADEPEAEIKHDPSQGPEKLVFAFQKQKDPKAIKEQADQLAAILTADLAIPVEVVVPSNYAASVEGLISNRVHVIYTDSLPFILARAEAPVRLLLAEERDGRTDYDSLFVVRKDSPLATLADLKGKRMMFTSATSTSGHLMARSRLVNEGLLKKGQDPAEFFSQVNFAGGYDRALLAVLNGQADVCAVSDYTMQGDKADVYLTKEQRDQLRVLAETPGVPTHLICVRADLPLKLQENIKEALLIVSGNHGELLSDVYGAAKLVEVDPMRHTAAIDKALENTGLSVNKFVDIKK